MKTSKQIARIMLADHNKIDKLLKNFIDNQDKDIEYQYKIFDIFSIKLERHFALEEQAIYAFSGITDDNDKILMTELTQEHEEMRKMAARIKNAIMTKQPIDLDNLKQTLIQHRKIEDTNLYPKLDKSLNEEEKKYITERISEMYQEFDQ